MDSKLMGKRIRERRLELNWTLQEVADKVKVNKSTIQRYESGNIKDPKLPVIESIANSLSVDPLWIIGKISIKSRSEEFERTTHLIEQYYQGVMSWSADRLFNEVETVVIREHFQEFLSRYKFIVEGTLNTKLRWEREKEDFTNLYKDRKSNTEIKELFFKQELEREINNATAWLDAFPNWIARREDELNRESVAPEPTMVKDNNEDEDNE